MPVKKAETKNGAENGTGNKSIKTLENEEAVEAPGSQPVAYYLKHKINEKLIEGLVDNNKFNNSLSGTRVRKKKGKTYKVLPMGPVYDAILKKKITKKEDIRGNFEIPCNIGGQKGINALVDQGSDVNVMPYTTYMKLTDERPTDTDMPLVYLPFRNSIVEHDIVESVEHVRNPVDFVILDIKENEKRPFILGTPFLTTAMVVIKFDKGTITLRSGKTPTMTVNRLVLEWEEKIKLHQEKGVKFDRWRKKNFKNERPTPVKIEDEVDDEGEVIKYKKIPPKRTTIPMSVAAIKALVARSVADALAEYEANRSRNGDDSSNSGRGGERRTVPTARECTYSNFFKCQPLNFKGTEGVFGLTQWFEKIEYVFHKSNCTVGNQIKFATCTLLGSALTWWNTHVKTIGHNVAYRMTWKTSYKDE
ncbi:zinc finger, CCHC-type containing protein [Tanacetum coccineum]